MDEEEVIVRDHADGGGECDRETMEMDEERETERDYDDDYGYEKRGQRDKMEPGIHKKKNANSPFDPLSEW